MARTFGSRWIAVIGDRVAYFAPQDSIGDAVAHSAAALGAEPIEVLWFPTELLERELAAGTDLRSLHGASGVWCAPGSPFRSLEGALGGIRFARERGLPFLGTCAGFQHGVIEFARNVVGVEDAGHAEYGHTEHLFIDELPCSLVGQAMEVRLIDQRLIDVYATATPIERYYCRFGLNPAWRQVLDDHGLLVAGIDERDGDVRVLRLADSGFYVLTLFVPQTSSTMTSPHPLITAFVAAALDTDPS